MREWKPQEHEKTPQKFFEDSVVEEYSRKAALMTPRTLNPIF